MMFVISFFISPRWRGTYTCRINSEDRDFVGLFIMESRRWGVEKS